MKKLYAIIILSTLLLTACSTPTNEINKVIDEARENAATTSVKLYINKVEHAALVEQIQDIADDQRVIRPNGEVNHNNVDVKNHDNYSNVNLTCIDDKVNGTISYDNYTFKVVDSIPYKQ